MEGSGWELFSVALIVAALYTANVVRQRGRAFWSEAPSAPVRELARRAGFLWLFPPSVVLHELGHAVATWAVGGRITEFSFFGYSGFVVPAGRFTPAQAWLISVAGPAVSVAVALGLLAAGRWAFRLGTTARLMLVDGGGLQLTWILVGYPLFALGGFGDFRVIYDVGATPVLCALAAVLHAGLIVALSRGLHGRAERAVLGAPPVPAQPTSPAPAVADEPAAPPRAPRRRPPPADPGATGATLP